jgi:hypothetical protein
MKPLQLGVGLLVTVASLTLHAQTLTAHANIPFEFRVGEKLMPAGEYSIYQSDSVLRLRQNDHGYAAVTALTYGVDQQSENPGLQFSRYGGSYFLESVSNPGFTARAVIKTREEQELARHSIPGRSTIALKTK